MDRHTLLVAIGTRRPDGANSQCLRSAIECRNQVPIDFVRRKALRFVRAEAPVCNEDRALTNGRVRYQIGIDPHRNVEANVLRIRQHEVAEVDPIDRRSGNRLWFLLDRRVGQNVVCSIEDSVLRVREKPLIAGTKKPRCHRTHLLAPAQRLEQQQLGLELFEPRKIEIRRI
jgi:hypothetical protein